MARKEQIDAWVKEKYPDTGLGVVCRDTAREAIQWADKTMINKACEWIEEHYLEFANEDRVDTIKFMTDFKRAISV